MLQKYVSAVDLSIVWVLNPVDFNQRDYNDKKHSSPGLRAKEKAEGVEELGELPKKLALINLLNQYTTFWKDKAFLLGGSCVLLCWTTQYN